MGVEVAPLEADLAKKNEYEHNRMQGSTYNYGNQDNVNAQTQHRLGQLGGSSSLFANQQQQNMGNSGYQNPGFNFNPNNPFAQSTNNTAFGFVRHQDPNNNYNQNNNANNNNPGNNNYM